MDWSYWWQGMVEGLATPEGRMCVCMGPFAAICGATAVHLALRSKARTIWSPFGLALLAYAGWLLGWILEPWIELTGPDGILTLVVVLLPPLGAVAIGIRRGYACTRLQGGMAFLGFCVAAYLALDLVTYLAFVVVPNSYAP